MAVLMQQERSEKEEWRLRSALLRPDRRLGPEDLDDFFVGLDVRAADEVDAVGHRGEYSRHNLPALLVLEAFEGFLDRPGLAGQVYAATCSYENCGAPVR